MICSKTFNLGYQKNIEKIIYSDLHSLRNDLHIGLLYIDQPCVQSVKNSVTLKMQNKYKQIYENFTDSIRKSNKAIAKLGKHY